MGVDVMIDSIEANHDLFDPTDGGFDYSIKLVLKGRKFPMEDYNKLCKILQKSGEIGFVHIDIPMNNNNKMLQLSFLLTPFPHSRAGVLDCRFQQ